MVEDKVVQFAGADIGMTGLVVFEKVSKTLFDCIVQTCAKTGSRGQNRMVSIMKTILLMMTLVLIIRSKMINEENSWCRYDL